jgi:hypothetical protein
VTLPVLGNGADCFRDPALKGRDFQSRHKAHHIDGGFSSTGWAVCVMFRVKLAAGS